MRLLICIIVLFAGLSFSYPCSSSSPGQCNVVSTNPNYAYCDNATNQCRCQTSQGFVGNATLEQKCFCPSDLDVFNVGGTPYCTSFQNGVNYVLEKKNNDHIIATVSDIYNKIIHPYPQITLYNLVHDLPDPYLDHFTNDTVGRVSPVGTFHGKALVVEYYGGATFTGATRIIKVRLQALTAYNNIGTSNVELHFNVMNSDQTQAVRAYNLTISGADKFRNGQIYTADKIIHNLDAAVTSVGTLNFSSPALHQQICYSLISLNGCAARDPNGYANMSDCIAFMASLKPGNLGDTLFDANTVACRYFHMVFTFADPNTHCPHTGKGGGGKCIVTPYIQYYYEQYLNKKRSEFEMNAASMNNALSNIILQSRLDLISAGIPVDSPLVDLPLRHFMNNLGGDDHGHKKNPIEQTKVFVDTMRANNFALYDSIMLPQQASLIKAGISPNHPMITGPRERQSNRRKRSNDFFVLDPSALPGSTFKITLPPVAA
jgi:hypothetical protein